MNMAGLTEAEFATLVDEALADMPEEILQHLNNVAITVADWPSADELQRAGVRYPQQLFGLYVGVPLTQRGGHYNLVTPDQITLYRGPLANAFRTPAALRQQIRHTVAHEIAHHFGINEARIRELGY
jgi:predicted Zn-dependent protease with MMP-like domain